MVIAVNTRLLLKDKLDGIGWFTYETLKRITARHPEHKFIFLFDRPYSKEFIFSSNVTPVIVPPPTRHPVLWYLWFEWMIPPVLRKYKADVFLSQDGWLSLSTNVKSINVIHDLNFIHYPQFVPYPFLLYYNHYLPKFARKAHQLATVSEFSKADIARQYNIDPAKIDVVYNGANESFVPVNFVIQESVKMKYTNGAPYFVFVGMLHSRKNIANLFYAFDKFKLSTSSNVKLLIVGEKKWWTKDIQEAHAVMQFKSDVVFTGRMATEELFKVMASALALTYVPVFEGFGIPMLEAMRCDVPVITSNVSCMPEISGGAALLVNPHSVDSIADGMISVYKDEGLRHDLILKGQKRRNDFTWDKTADKLWLAVEKCF